MKKKSVSFITHKYYGSSSYYRTALPDLKIGIFMRTEEYIFSPHMLCKLTEKVILWMSYFSTYETEPQDGR